tara:strand:+ start:507 stop:1403 length:897 start_codon:yes stop_codon:yes gene_type:complete
MQYLYSFQFIENEDTKVHKKYFNDCFSSVNSLFVTLVSLIIELQNKSQKQLNISKKSISGIQNKRYLSKNFSQNLLIKNLSNNRIILKEIANKNIVNWDINFKLIDSLYNEIINSEIYDKYILTEQSSFEIDKKFVSSIFSEIIIHNDNFYDFIQESNIFWSDDFPFVNSLIIRFIKNSKNEGFVKSLTLELFSSKSDENFAKFLFKSAIFNHKSNLSLINKYLKNWDVERIAKIDLVLISIAISEIVNIDSIPMKVSLNEYIEIAKDYSSEKSSFFINGVLDKICRDLKKNKKLTKE